jgi:hypothetical protein
MADAEYDQDIRNTLEIYENVKWWLDNPNNEPVFHSNEIKSDLTAKTIVLMLGRFKAKFNLIIKPYRVDQDGNTISYIIEVTRK